MPKHTVTPGDCFNSIAKQKGFFNYQTVYKHGTNKTNFPNPNTLEEGKEVDVPDKVAKKVALKIDKENKFLLDRRKTKLRVALVDADFKPVKVKTCKTHVGIDSTALPNNKGLIELTDIDPTITDGTINIEFDVPPVPVGMPAPAPVDPKAYPIKIVEVDFRDKNPDPVDQSKVEWTLKIGSLEPHATIRGITHRLRNYGFTCPNVKIEDEHTKSAVNAYQVALKLKKKGEETGKIADIRDDIKKRHDQL